MSKVMPGARWTFIACENWRGMIVHCAVGTCKARRCFLDDAQKDKPQSLVRIRVEMRSKFHSKVRRNYFASFSSLSAPF